MNAREVITRILEGIADLISRSDGALHKHVDQLTVINELVWALVDDTAADEADESVM